MDSGFPTNAEPQAASTVSGSPALPQFEPFYDEWQPASEATAEPAALVLNNRQLAIIGFLGMTAMALMAALAYIAGRSAGNGPGEVLMVESARPAVVASSVSSTPESAPKPSSQANSAQQAVLQASPVRTGPLPAPATADLSKIQPGDSYWQVGALDPGMAAVSKKYLEESGLSVRLEAVAGSKQLRVMAGPATGDNVEAIRKRLLELGFQPFLKKY